MRIAAAVEEVVDAEEMLVDVQVVQDPVTRVVTVADQEVKGLTAMEIAQADQDQVATDPMVPDQWVEEADQKDQRVQKVADPIDPLRPVYPG